MSDLDNSRSKAELGVSYTPLRDYLREIVANFDTHSIRAAAHIPPPPGRAELRGTSGCAIPYLKSLNALLQAGTATQLAD